ncbi:MAG: hypothetical protein K8R57_08235 [Verrucomicrobia bacterium]|nr:hypothetical protein [Verrucomicrobiota bacterium]
MRKARVLYAGEDLGLELENTVLRSGLPLLRLALRAASQRVFYLSNHNILW